MDPAWKRTGRGGNFAVGKLADGIGAQEPTLHGAVRRAAVASGRAAVVAAVVNANGIANSIADNYPNDLAFGAADD